MKRNLFGSGYFVSCCIGLPIVTCLLSGCITEKGKSDLRLNQIQVIGTHNSYHLRAPESLRTLLKSKAPEEANGLDYEHPPLSQQLDNGIRQVELDCFADPDGGRFSK